MIKISISVWKFGPIDQAIKEYTDKALSHLKGGGHILQNLDKESGLYCSFKEHVLRKSCIRETKNLLALAIIITDIIKKN